MAILDSGIDYTHRNLGGPGTAAAYTAAYGANGALATSRDGFDFVGELNEEFSGRAVVSMFNCATATATAESHYAVDADLYSGQVILTALGLTDDSTFSFSVKAYDNYFTNQVSDTVGPMTFTPSRPRFMVAGGATQGIAAGRRATFTVEALAGGGRASPAQEGLLLLYRGNAVKDADLIVPR